MVNYNLQYYEGSDSYRTFNLGIVGILVYYTCHSEHAISNRLVSLYVDFSPLSRIVIFRFLRPTDWITTLLDRIEFVLLRPILSLPIALHLTSW